MAIDAMLTPIPRWLEPPDSDKPYVEIVHGRRERKMSPKRTHGMLQGRLARSNLFGIFPVLSHVVKHRGLQPAEAEIQSVSAGLRWAELYGRGNAIRFSRKAV